MKTRSRATGCWTCRIRHVKCGSETPSCRECSSRHTECHGYGPQPIWMDGGHLEAAERSRIRAAIKKNFRRIRKEQNQARRQPPAFPSHRQAVGETRRAEESLAGQDPQPRLAPPTTSVPVSPITPSNCSTSVSYNENRTYSTAPTPRSVTQSPAAPDSGTLFRPALDANANILNVDAYEAGLLMHYFDHVFPWQFPYHNSHSRTGNRGWLLQLLTKRGPLYHAAIGLSSLHQSATRGMDENYLQNQKVFDHHSTALQELCEFLRSEKATEFHQDEQLLTEFLACSIMLLSFEVLRGGRSNWQPHLNAVLGTIKSTSPASFIATEENKPESLDSLPKAITRVSNNVASSGLEFLYANALWFDIFACVSTGDTPVLHYRSWLAIGQFKMQDVMGCHNWALALIGDITHLRKWKDDMDRQGLLSARELVNKGQAIESELEEKISLLCSTNDETCSKSHTIWITHIFALAALVQVHTVVSGPLPSLPEIQSTVQRAIDLLTSKPKNCSLQGIVWPLCVIGCMAEPRPQFFFENLISGMATEYRKLGNSSTVLQIMKGCWALQQNGRKDCTSAMSELNIHALLV
ncbi:unnamed protein product [Clonostachys rosea]|uniref:Zn(2)-C6 fungal-type domain-containing protein n=1 Tax=Bionectria ochroleuca TaxID=29856 RepID=A0ABY6UFX4_BIOOC|nr:unnamed protein product [Clonostachys rosea]